MTTTTKKPKQPDDTKNSDATQETTPTEVVKPDVVTTALVKKVDHEAKLVEMRETTRNRVLKLIDGVADEAQKKGLSKLLKTMQPIKGREEMNQAWNIPAIRIAYGTTKDPGKPASARPGDMFSSNGRIVTPPFIFTPLYMFESHRMFQDNSAQPTCWSPDGKLGKMFGECAKCPHLPLGKNKSGGKTDCNSGISVVALGKDMQVYRIEFFKTSRRAGGNLDKLTQSGSALWERWYTLTAQHVNKDNYEYDVFKVAAEGTDVPEELQEVAEAFYEFIDVERKAFLHKFYVQVSNGESVESTGPVGEGVDESLMSPSGGDTNPDLSDSGM